MPRRLAFSPTGNTSDISLIQPHRLHNTMALPPNGLYIITSAAGDRPQIGRYYVEDLSLLPKRVLSLTSGGPPTRPWMIVKEGDGYIMRASDAPTTEIDGKLWAALLDQPEPVRWKILPSLENGPNAYTIKTSDGQRGWTVASDEENSQILVQPPSGSINEVFIIQPVDL